MCGLAQKTTLIIGQRPTESIMSTVKHYGSAKKKAKPTDEVLKSRIFQAIKAVSKAVKIVKTFLILKCTKKLSTLREGLEPNSSNDKIEKELATLETLKALDQGVVAAAIVKLKVAFGNDSNYNPASAKTDSAINPELLSTIMKHKKVEETISEIQTKITTTIEKNNELRAKEQSKAATTKAKSIFTKKDGSGYVDGTKAVFMDSLDAANESSEKKMPTQKDLVKLNKSLRNQANRMANRANKKPEDSDNAPAKVYEDEGNSRDNNDPSLHMYRPLDQRFPSAATAAKSAGNNRRGPAPGGNNPRQGNDRHERSDRGGSAGGGRGGGPDRRVGAAPSRPRAAAPPVHVPSTAELSKAASFGKEWKTTGVHPSWAAKQHAKQQSVGAIPSVGAGAAGQGKKIVFDD